MADIVLTCPKCNFQTKVSEYISDSSVTCSACGESMHMPKKEKVSTGLKLRKIPSPESQPEEFVDPQGPEPAKATIVTASVKRKSAMQDAEQTRVKTSARLIVLSWVIFVILAGILGYFRFYREVPGLEKGLFIEYGLIAIAVCYLLIVILALKDNMFDGLLCIVVPMYPFYYILSVSNLVIVRAIVAAILVGFGYDMALFLQDVWDRVFRSVTGMIRNAGD